MTDRLKGEQPTKAEEDIYIYDLQPCMRMSKQRYQRVVTHFASRSGHYCPSFGDMTTYSAISILDAYYHVDFAPKKNCNIERKLSSNLVILVSNVKHIIFRSG